MKIHHLALAALATFTLSAAAAPKTPKKKKNVSATAVVKSDLPAGKASTGTHFSYAYGVAQVPDMKSYLLQTQGIDSTQYLTLGQALEGRFSDAEIARYRAIVTGADIARQVKANLTTLDRSFGGSENSNFADASLILKGMSDGLAGRASFTADSAKTVVNDQRDFQIQERYRANLAYLDNYKKQKGAVALPSGLLYKVVRKGTGALPADTSTVEVNYEGKLIDGTVFDSSYQRGQTTSFPLNQVIKGWQEGLKLMPVGSEYELVIPYQLAYGEAGTRGIPPFATLIFKVELKDIKK